MITYALLAVNALGGDTEGKVLDACGADTRALETRTVVKAGDDCLLLFGRQLEW